MFMRGRGNKGQNVARLQRVSPDGLICAYDKTDAEIFETADAFLMKLNLDKKALSVIHRGPIVFMFDLELRRLCGIFQAFEAQIEEFAVYKIDVRVRERCLPLDWPELRKVVAENDLKLNKFPEILSPDQVLGLSNAFRKASQPLPPYSHPASVPVILEDRFYEHHQRGGYSQPQFGAETLWDHQFEDPLNDAETRVRDGGGYPRQLDGQTVNLMEPPTTYATTATVDSSRQMNPGWKQQPELGLKTVLCSSTSDHQLAYGHPIASQRSSFSNVEENGFAYPRQARSVYSTAIPFECAEGMLHQQQQHTPLGLPLGKNGDERVPGKQYVQSPAAAPMHKKVRDESVAKPSSRESAFNRINGLEAASKSSVKRVKQLQAEPSCLENRQAKNKRKQPKPPEKVSVFCRLQRPKPQSVFNRIECSEAQQQQQQKQLQLQKQEKQQISQHKHRQQQVSERKKRDDELQAKSRQAQSKMIRTSRKESAEKQEDLLPECFEKGATWSSIPDFRRRSKEQSVDKADNDCSSPDNLPKPKRRRFVRPEV